MNTNTDLIHLDATSNRKQTYRQKVKLKGNPNHTHSKSNNYQPNDPRLPPHQFQNAQTDNLGRPRSPNARLTGGKNTSSRGPRKLTGTEKQADI